MDAYAIITAVDTPSRGWYKASISIWGSDILVSGVSVRGIALKVGERVNVVQCLYTGSGDEYGFFKADDEYSVIQVASGDEQAVKELYPNQFLLTYIARKAYNTECMYGTGVIQSILSAPSGGIVAALCNLVLSGTQEYMSFDTENVNPEDFKAGDEVLISYWPTPYRKILGWWDTVPSTTPIPPTAIYPVWRMFSDEGISYIAKSYISGAETVNAFTKEIPLDISARTDFRTGRAYSYDPVLYGVCRNGTELTGYSYDIENDVFEYTDFTPTLADAGDVTSFAAGKILYLDGNNLYISDYNGDNEQDISSVVPPGSFGFNYANLFYLNGDYFVLAQYSGVSRLFNLTNGLSFYTSPMAGVKLAGYNEATGEYYVLCNDYKDIFDPETMTVSSSVAMSLPYNVGVAPVAMSQNNVIKFGNSYLFRQGATSVTRESISSYYTGEATWLLSERDY